MSNKIHKGDDKVLLGVCSGFAEYLKVDKLIVRALALILCFLADPISVSIMYVLTAMIMPPKDNDNGNSCNLV